VWFYLGRALDVRIRGKPAVTVPAPRAACGERAEDMTAVLGTPPAAGRRREFGLAELIQPVDPEEFERDWRRPATESPIWRRTRAR